MFIPRLKVNSWNGDSRNIKDIPFYKYAYPYRVFTYPLPNCTVYAYGRTMELCSLNGGNWQDIKSNNNPYWWNGKCAFGNAETWFNEAKKIGHWQVGSRPKLGAIACWSGAKRHYGGHVGIVEEINGDKVTIAQSNYGGALFTVNKVKLEVGKITSYVGEVFLGYIYNPYIIDAPKPTKSVEQVAQEVIDGKWGNGYTRKQRLEQAGYNYVEVQQKVNELLNTKQYYIVKRGDTMSKIAKQFSTTLSKLKTLNPEIKNINLILVGQKVRVR